MSFGGIFIVVGSCIVSRKYRKFLAASQNAHREKWHKRDGVSEEDYVAMNHGDMKMLSMGPTETPPPPQYGRNDELFLPDDVQRVGNRVNEVQLQHHRLPAETYGSVTRKPLPAYRDF